MRHEKRDLRFTSAEALVDKRKKTAALNDERREKRDVRNET